ncbi:TlpA family protein disulfide reductase [Carboxylicivirga mesophila]|uniref:TlpA family protein disulfide reductase n=1 Tax=Carboxylicivirga mesophila TaxID=1166478 RepID=A0ABS5K4X3_9BACT|nr:TlpA disulfide reductase family protein [Carboxylicivirga mesophila]MBS2210056.1 TlpA family protein disulfide reductase [Carboxylicivirga mesophila]
MKKGFWAEQWYKYRRKKTIFGIVFDFLFTALLIAMIFPASRKVVQSTIIRYSMFQPRESKDITYLSDGDYNWHIEDMEGNVIQLSELKGEVLFINFWATWCPPCIAEMPSIQRLYDEYKDKMAFILVSKESKSILQEFIKAKGYTFPVYVLRSREPDVFTSRSIPASFLVSPEGQLMMKKQGAARWDGDKVKALIDEMLQ